MRLITFAARAGSHVGALSNGTVVDLNEFEPRLPTDLRQCLVKGIDLEELGGRALRSKVPRLDFNSLQLLPVITEPGKIICLGLNYHAHAQEGGRERPDYPWIFLRCSSSLIAHGAPGKVPAVSSMFDYEAELALVIGASVPRLCPPAQAERYVFGYSCFNDMSVRDYQRRTPQWTMGKNFDHSGAFGPAIVTKEELPSLAKGLRIQTRLNGVVVQDSNTAEMMWDVAQTISILSEAMTLQPGDVIVMGTPAGVGSARTPPVWMKAGDVVEVEIAGIGVLRNPIHA